MRTLPRHAHPVERDIAHGLVNRVLSDGYTISVHDGEECPIKRSSNAVAILSAMASTGSDSLIIRDPNGDRIGSVYLVYGNEPENLIADCSWATYSNYSGERYMLELCSPLLPFHAVMASDLDAAYPEV
jgi:hypothetical protein